MKQHNQSNGKINLALKKIVIKTKGMHKGIASTRSYTQEAVEKIQNLFEKLSRFIKKKIKKKSVPKAPNLSWGNSPTGDGFVWLQSQWGENGPSKFKVHR